MPEPDPTRDPAIAVWLIEDNPTFRTTVRRVIDQSDGLACPRDFANCEDALAALGRGDAPDIVLHHVIATAHASREDQEGRSIAGYAPGMGAYAFPEGTGILLPKGAKLHYAASGKAETDRTRRVLLSVPNYNFNGQRDYHCREPVALPKGTRLVVRAAWDNSALNPHNPDPSKEVRWGDQTFEEMFYASFKFTIPK